MATVAFRLFAVAGLASVLALPAPSAEGQDLEPTFRTVTELVVVQPVVFAAGGGPVARMRRSDFHVALDGVDAPIEVFIPPGDERLELVLLVDSSHSMAVWPVESAAHVLLDGIDPGSCVLLATFDEEVRAGVWGHPSDPALRATVENLEFAGDTALYDALLYGFDVMRTRPAIEIDTAFPIDAPSYADLMRFRYPLVSDKRPHSAPTGTCSPIRRDVSDQKATPTRRAVAVLTDGEDTGSLATIDDVVLAAWGSRVPVFAFAALKLPQSGNQFVRGRVRRLGGLRGLERLAKFTGGAVIREYLRIGRIGARVDKGIWRGIERLGAALRDHYVLGVAPPKPILQADEGDLAREHRLEIRVPSGFDVLSEDSLFFGTGVSEGAALDLALRGFQSLVGDNSDAALRSFHSAIGLCPSLGIAHYGLSATLAAQGDYPTAMTALARARELAPWLPDLDARLASLLLLSGDFKGAWEHALLARRAGSNVDDLVRELDRVAPDSRPDGTLQAPLGVSIGHVRASSLAGSIVAPRLLGSLGHALDASERVNWVRSRANIQLDVEVRDADQGRDRVSASFEVTAVDVANEDKIARRRFRVEDLGSPGAMNVLFEELQAWLVEVSERFAESLG